MNEKEPPRSDSSLESQDENTSGSQAIAKGKEDKHVDRYFAKLPRALAQATAEAQLDVYDLGILAFIIAASDWRTNQYVSPSLRALKDNLDWPYKEDSLRKRLVRLRELTWLEFESTQGKRTAYLFRLGQRYYDSMILLPLDSTSARIPPFRTEVTSDDIPFGEPLSPLPQNDSPPSQPQSALLSKNENENESESEEPDSWSSEGNDVGEATEGVPIYRRGFAQPPSHDEL
jgi:hypothetical protein